MRREKSFDRLANREVDSANNIKLNSSYLVEQQERERQPYQTEAN